jgi:hypothetical protein
MRQNTLIDNYTLTLDVTSDGVGGQSFRAVATNITDRRIVEAQLDADTLRSLLIHTYGGEINTVELYVERLAAQQAVQLEATATDPVILTADELLRYGFLRMNSFQSSLRKPDRLEPLHPL